MFVQVQAAVAESALHDDAAPENSGLAKTFVPRINLAAFFQPKAAGPEIWPPGEAVK